MVPMFADVNSSAPNATSSLPPPSDAPGTTDAASYYLMYASVYACGALFLVPSGVAWTRMWRNRHIDNTAVRLFVLLGMGTLLRAAAFVLVAMWMLGAARSSGSAKDARHLHLSYLDVLFVWQLLGMLGSFVLGGVFLLVFNTWASMIEQVVGAAPLPAIGSSMSPSLAAMFATGLSRRTTTSSTSSSLPSTPSPPRVVFIKLVIAIYVLHIATFVALQPGRPNSIRRSLHFVATLLLACCFVVCQFLLPAYGVRMCGLLAKVADDTAHRQRNIKRIAAIATLFCLMRTTSLLLLAASQYGDDASAGSDSSTYAPSSTSAFVIPTRVIIEQNPIFFVTASGGSTATGLLRWVVRLEVMEFPLEWMLLVSLLCVLPSKAVLPSIRGYEPIVDKRYRH